jgi:hypothetical protein
MAKIDPKPGLALGIMPTDGMPPAPGLGSAERLEAAQAGAAARFRQHDQVKRMTIQNHCCADPTPSIRSRDEVGFFKQLD